MTSDEKSRLRKLRGQINAYRFSYPSGEKIQKGDHVLYDGQSAEIEFVAESITGNPELDWYVEQEGGGVMISVSFGPVFVGDPHDDCALEFVSRADGAKDSA